MVLVACFFTLGCPQPTNDTKDVIEKDEESTNDTKDDAEDDSTVKNEESTEATKSLINEAIELLLEPDVDGGIAKIKAAYEQQQNNETALYYALAEIASISVDENVEKLFTENLGIVNYPSTLNALINGSWLKEYEYEDYDYDTDTTYTSSILLPEFKAVEGIEATSNAQDLITHMIYALIDCNPKGLNETIDNILGIFSTKYENAKNIIAKISNASVEIPNEFFVGLELDEILGKSSLKIGKAELNVLIAAMELIEGTFQWIASYDWSFNVATLKEFFDSVFENEEINFSLLAGILNEKTLEVRSNQAMADSKKSFIEAIDLIVESYDYLVSDDSDYPQAVIDEIKETGDEIKAEVLEIRTAISSGGIYSFDVNVYVENEEQQTVTIKIDFGKLFTPGHFSSILEKDSNNKIKFYVNFTLYDNNYDTIHTDYLDISDCESEEDIEALVNAAIEEYINNSGLNEEDIYDFYISICIKWCPQLLLEVFPDSIYEDEELDSYIYLF